MTFVTYLLYQHTQYATFNRPNKTDGDDNYPREISYQGDLKISKTEENKHGAVIPDCSAKSETLYWD